MEEEQEGTSGRKPYQDGASAAEGSVDTVKKCPVCAKLIAAVQAMTCRQTTLRHVPVKAEAALLFTTAFSILMGYEGESHMSVAYLPSSLAAILAATEEWKAVGA
eukprot:55204-Eustigmatos_ZCMA.PRE.1